MFSIEKTQQGDVTLVEMSGAIIEGAKFSESFGEVGPELHIHCKNIHRINSTGITLWRNYFKGLRARPVKLRFFECSAAVVEQMNLIPDLIAETELVSLCLAYHCDSCNRPEVVVIQPGSIDRKTPTAPEIPCPKCKRRLEFDDLPEEYFHFLTG